jgi:hypothetical protein
MFLQNADNRIQDYAASQRLLSEKLSVEIDNTFLESMMKSK